MTLEEALKRIEVLEERLDWLRQTVHQAHHEGSLDECQKNTCDGAIQVLGKRESTMVFEFTDEAMVVELDEENRNVVLEVYRHFEGGEPVVIKVPTEDVLREAAAKANLLYRPVKVTIRLDKMSGNEG